MKRLVLSAEVILPDSEEPDMLRLDLSVLLRSRAIEIVKKAYKLSDYHAAHHVSKIKIEDVGSDQRME